MLQLTSCQARNTFPLMREFAGYVERRLGIPTGYEHDSPWRERLRKLLVGELQLAWICSKPYALQLEDPKRCMYGIAVPVMEGELYRGRPVYFSYLAVRRGATARSLRDLRGATAAYNEAGSQSGYFSLVGALADIGEERDFFASWIESGAHTQSVDLLLSGKVDVAAIDSTLWDYEVHSEVSARLDGLEILDTLGPYPGPPLAAHDSIPAGVRQRLRDLCVAMHEDPEGQRILALSRIAHFAPVDDDAYRSLC